MVLKKEKNSSDNPALQEAVSTGDPEMVQLVLQRRDYLKASTALGGVPELLAKIREVSPYKSGCHVVIHQYRRLLSI